MEDVRPNPKTITPDTNESESPETPSDEGMTPEGNGDQESIERLKTPEEMSPGKTRSKSESGGSFSPTSMFDRMKDKASEFGEAARKRTRRVQNRSAEHDARKAQQVTERVMAEVSNTVTSLVKSGVSLTVGGTYGTVTGLAKGASPTHVQTIRDSDRLRHAGSWSRFHKGADYDNEKVDWFEVDINDEAAGLLGCDPGEGELIVNKGAKSTKIELEGHRSTVISSPLMHPENDRMVGVLVFVKDGPLAGQILVHLEE